jgi:hypothetical protein
LGLLFKLVDTLLLLSDFRILQFYLLGLFSDLVFKLQSTVLLLLQLFLFLSRFPLEFVNFELKILDFVLIELEFSLRLEGDLLHLDPVLLVFVSHILLLVGSIGLDLVDDLSVVVLHLVDLHPQLSDLALLGVHLGLEGLFLLVQSSLVLVVDFAETLTESGSIVVFLSLKLLEPSRVLEHLLSVFVSLIIKFNQIIVLKLLDPLFKG